MKRILIVMSFGALAACTSEPTAADPDRFGDIDLVADQGTLPAESNGLSILTQTDKDTGDIWTYFGFDGEPPNVEGTDKVALFVGTGESGSCPIELEGVEVHEDEIFFDVAEHAAACTSDFRARSFVFLFPSSNAPKVGDRVNLGPTKIQSAQSVVSDGTALTVIDGRCAGKSRSQVGDSMKEVRLEIRPCPSDSASTPKLVLINTGEGRLGFGPGFKLERKQGQGWRWVNRRQAFHLPLIYLPQGTTSKPEPIEVYIDKPKPLELKPGIYRVSKTLQLTPGKMRPPTMTVRATFKLSSALAMP